MQTPRFDAGWMRGVSIQATIKTLRRSLQLIHRMRPVHKKSNWSQRKKKSTVVRNTPEQKATCEHWQFQVRFTGCFLPSGWYKLENKTSMDLIRIGLRAGEFHSCLRKEQLTDLTKRQRCNADQASTKGKTAISEILYVHWPRKNVLIRSSVILHISRICISISSDKAGFQVSQCVSQP